ncbi:hypothetical protein J2X48_000918 [Bosea sp. BE271]|uniref:hypothetical protein n=1 Tax=Bosea TaxID=85413 RepID=UPI00285B336E|nr:MULTISPECIES: hypothetical protein [Bosea]MDR6827200.1 hypothetical protein [Bosea robiniae]MDR6893910.1 hypothetical protein [Bosea sp. BE109]MDR7137305.1 hypothetical protein [Bosea sp. BE168]MDR7174005.1 hypothetical protein [Bosea sp. BE271]
MPAAASASPAKPGQRSAREALAKQITALEGQCQSLGVAVGEARADCNRATARASVDGSKAASDAKANATGAVVRAEAELKATQDALQQVQADLLALDEKRAGAARAAKLKDAGAAVQSLIAHAERADQAALEFARSFQALLEEVGRLYSSLPAHLKEPVFGGGQNLGAQALLSTASFLISKSTVIPRPLHAPSEHRQSLAALVSYFGKPVLDEAAATPQPDTEWE